MRELGLPPSQLGFGVHALNWPTTLPHVINHPWRKRKEVHRATVWGQVDIGEVPDRCASSWGVGVHFPAFPKKGSHLIFREFCLSCLTHFCSHHLRGHRFLAIVTPQWWQVIGWTCMETNITKRIIYFINSTWTGHLTNVSPETLKLRESKTDLKISIASDGRLLFPTEHSLKRWVKYLKALKS